MKASLLLCGSCVALAGLAAPARGEAPSPTPAPAPVAMAPPALERLQTTDGRVYEGIQALKVKQDGLAFMHRDGAATVPFTALPADIQKRYGYDPAKAQIYAQQEAAKRAANEKALNAEFLAQEKARKDVGGAKAVADKVAALRWAQWVADHQAPLYCPPTREDDLRAAADAKFLRDGK